MTNLKIKYILCDAVMMEINHYIFIKLLWVDNTNSDPLSLRIAVYKNAQMLIQQFDQIYPTITEKSNGCVLG